MTRPTGRPIKYTVDYFPHICKQGKTLKILEANYGNNGYAFWFKLLEQLATTDGHYLDTSDPIQLEFLGALTGFPGEETLALLNLLARLNAIDPDLWVNHSVIWSEHLVENLTVVYQSRKGLLPEKPYFLEGKLRQNIDNHRRNPINLPDNTQSRVEYSIGNTKVLPTKDNNADTGSIFKAFEDNFQKLTEANAVKLSLYIDEHGVAKVKDALDQAIKYNKRNLAYVEAILEGKGGTHRRGDKPNTGFSNEELRRGAGVGEDGFTPV